MIVEKLAEWWAVDDSHHLPPYIDIVFPVTHGMTPFGASTGLLQVTERAQALTKEKYTGHLIYGVLNAPGAEIEIIWKKRMFPRGIFAGRVKSTIDECLVALKALDGMRPNSIAIVTDEAHSRRCRIIWKTFFPNAQIYIVPVKLSETKDRESFMLPYRSMWRTFLLQALPTPLYWWWSRKGPAYLAAKANIHQKM